MKNLFLFLIIISSFYSYANRLDSLIAVLATNPVETKHIVLHEIGIEYYKLSKHNEAMVYFNKALTINKKKDNTQAVIENYYYIALIYSTFGDIKKSLNNSFIALKLTAQTENTKKRECILLSLIGTNFSMLNDTLKSQKYLLNAVEIATDSGYEYELAYASNILGTVAPNNSDESYNYFIKARKIAKKLNNTKLLTTVNSNLGAFYMGKNDYKKAMPYFSTALKLIDSKNYKMRSGLLINLGGCKFELKMYAESIKDLKKALNISIENELIREQTFASHSLSDCYEKLQKHKQALKYYKLFKETSDDFDGRKIAVETSEMEMQFIFEKQQLTDSLKWMQRQERNLAKVKSRENWLFFLVIILFILVLFSIIIFIQKKQTLTSNKQLVQRNLELINFEKQFKIQKKTMQKSLQVTIKDKQKKYSSSSLSKNQKNDLMNNIIALMEEQKIFTNKQITLGLLAEMLGTNKNYISQVLNSSFKKNFANFINEYRVKEARIQLSNPQNKNLTIESIAHQVGFRSKSTFNAVFKNHTGITPSFFMKSITKK